MAERPRPVAGGRQERASQRLSYACSLEWYFVELSPCTQQGLVAVVAGEVEAGEDPVGIGKRVYVISHIMAYFSGCIKILCRVNIAPHPATTYGMWFL